MTITTTFVEMVQTKAMQDTIISFFWLTILFGPVLAITPMLLLWDTDKPFNWKLYIKTALIFTIVVFLLQLPEVITDYRLWRDFPAQMIIDKLT